MYYFGLTEPRARWALLNAVRSPANYPAELVCLSLIQSACGLDSAVDRYVSNPPNFFSLNPQDYQLVVQQEKLLTFKLTDLGGNHTLKFLLRQDFFVWMQCYSSDQRIHNFVLFTSQMGAGQPRLFYFCPLTRQVLNSTPRGLGQRIFIVPNSQAAVTRLTNSGNYASQYVKLVPSEYLNNADFSQLAFSDDFLATP